MTKTFQHHERRVQANIDAAAARLYASFSPEELADEARRYRVERARLVEMFGEKSSYSDDEIEVMIRVLEAQC
jgi:hypothetical protein